jgi:hypothetical protein
MNEPTDAMEALRAVSRKVGLRQTPSGDGHTVLLTRTYQAEIDDLWEACTSAERIGRWLMPVEARTAAANTERFYVQMFAGRAE